MNHYEPSLVPAIGSGLAVALGLFALVWIASVVRRDASLVDRFWGLAFVLLGGWYALRGPGPLPAIGSLVLVLVTIWGVRLSAYLTWRNWGKGEDYRYAAMRQRQGVRFEIRSLATVFLLQAVLAWIIAMPLAVALVRSAAPGDGSAAWIVAGVVVWLVGFGFEAVGDLQLARHLADSGQRGRVLQTGLWRYTRHPNYFGDALVWWGLWLLAVPAGGAWTVFAPLLMTILLMRVSGVTLLERKLVASRPEYRDYAARTNAFFPGLPRRHRSGTA